jgi:hypothetical protein
MRPGELSAGEVRPAVHGKPLMGGELVSLQRREGSPSLYDVKVHHKAAPSSTTGASKRTGPAQVATAAYRDAWERTFRPLPS